MQSSNFLKLMPEDEMHEALIKSLSSNESLGIGNEYVLIQPQLNATIIQQIQLSVVSYAKDYLSIQH